MISLTTRVTLSAVVVLAIFIALTALALEQAFEQNARNAMRERLAAQLYLVMADAELDAAGRLQMPDTLGEPRLNLPGSGLYAWVRSGAGKVLWRSASSVGWQTEPPLAERNFARIAVGQSPYFLSSLAIDWETNGALVPLRFSVAEDLNAFTQELARYRQTLWTWLGAMAALLVAILAGTLIWGLRPLRRAAAEVAAVEAGAQERLQLRYPRELQSLTGNINTLLAHERAQQLRYRDALADLAHSLKTPLAVLRGLKQDDGNNTAVEEQVARMDAIVQYQLQRAATAGRSALAAPIEVAPVTGRLLNSLDKVYHDKGVKVEQRIAGNARFRGEEGDLMELLGNLLDNAFKWCKGGVWLSVGATSDRLHISVEDDGPGISPGQREAIFARGVRLDEATPGHGIGMAMVRDIVAAYGGELSIDGSSHGGARITLSLPG